MSERLDKRPWLYVEPRLSNAQVKALRELAKGPIDWTDIIRLATLKALRGSLLVDVSGDVAEISPRGRKILALIDEAAA